MENQNDSTGYDRNNSNHDGQRARRPRIKQSSGDGYQSSGRNYTHRPSAGYQTGRDDRRDNNRPNRYNNRDGYNRSDNGYQHRDGEYQNRENRYQNRDGGYQNREGGYQNRDNNRYNRNGNSEYRSNRPNRNNNPDGEYQNKDNRRYDQNNPNNGFKNKSFDNKQKSGRNPHAKYSQKKQIEYKKQYVDYSLPMRLNKFLANAGICSRREADDFITAGVVTVNGEVVNELGHKIIPATDKVMFHDQPVKVERKVYILLNKPKDCVTTVEDTHDRKTVLDLVKNACSERVYPVGRLDRNTTGVLLITNDGDLTSKLTHPKYDKKKIYQVVLDKDLTDDDYYKIKEGIVLEDGEIKVDEIEFVKEDDRKTVGVEIHSGRNRIVRRIFDSLGYRVTRLDRVYFAGLTKKNLPRGKWRYLSEMEVNMLKMSAAAMKD